MDFDLDPGWSLEPVGGTTGGAYLGVHAHEKYFLKRNASPFLAALSVTGITPKLIWTKRISTGDVLTAQEWLNGQTLTRAQMNSPRVAQLLAKVHESALLRRMLVKVNGVVMTAAMVRERTLLRLPAELRNHALVQTAIAALAVAPAAPSRLTVLHGDLNHKNWLLSDTDRLYLVDWDQAALGDRAFDLASVLVPYVPTAEWGTWLAAYGLPFDADLAARLRWYGVVNLLGELARTYHAQRYTEMNQYLLALQGLLERPLDTFNA